MPWINTNDRMNFSAQHRKAIPMLNKTNHSHLRRISSVQNPTHSTLGFMFSLPCAHHHLSACIFLRTSTSCFCPFRDFSSFFFFSFADQNQSILLIKRSVPFRVACVCVCTAFSLFFSSRLQRKLKHEI